MNCITDGQISKVCECLGRLTFQRNNNTEHILILVNLAVLKGWAFSTFQVTVIISCIFRRFAHTIF